MPVLETRAYAKLNLSLDVLDRRSDGYHEMRMVMQTVTLSDALRLETGTGKPLSMRSSLGFLPADERNLAAAAALRLCAETGADCGGLSIELDKSIPVCAGLAGGSADAAAVLRGLNRLLGLGLPPERLEAIGARVGSRRALLRPGRHRPGRGAGGGAHHSARPARLPCGAVQARLLGAHAGALRQAGRLPHPPPPGHRRSAGRPGGGGSGWSGRRMYNVFEDVLPERRGAEVQRIKNALVQQGALGASMSGTGSTVFGLFDREEAARRAYELLQESYRDTFLARSLEKMV